MLHKNTSQSKILIVPEEGWFGQPKYSTHSKKSFHVVSFCAFIFSVLYLKPIRSLLIQHTPVGSSFRLLDETFYSLTDEAVLHFFSLMRNEISPIKCSFPL